MTNAKLKALIKEEVQAILVEEDPRNAGFLKLIADTERGLGTYQLGSVQAGFDQDYWKAWAKGYKQALLDIKKEL